MRIKIRKCRACGLEYTPPSSYPGCCSLKCKKKRESFLVSKKKGSIKHNQKSWFKLRYQALLKYGRKCACCGAIDKLHVDHIKPKSKYPELEWDINNLQILCEACNFGKSYTDETDFR